MRSKTIWPVVAVIFIATGLSSASGLPSMSVEWTYNAIAQMPMGFYVDIMMLVDLDGDGVQEIVSGSYQSGRMIAVEPPGELLWVYPPLDQAKLGFGPIHACTDLDGDGKQEILICADANVQCLNWDGTLRWSWTEDGANFMYNGVVSVGDINGDGRTEILAGGLDANLWVISDTGTTMWSKNLPPGGALLCPPLVFDIDRDGQMEIMVGADTQGGFEGGTNSYLWCLTPTGDVRWKWSSTWNRHRVGHLTIADVNNDGEYELLNPVYNLDSGGAGGLILISFFGTELARFEVSSPCPDGPKLYDIDGDGRMEAMIGERAAFFHCLDAADLSEVWSLDYSDIVGAGSGAYYYSSALGDVTGDGNVDIVLQTRDNELNSTVIVLSLLGQLEVEPYQLTSSCLTTCAIGDVDNNGKSEIIALSDDAMIYCLTLDGPYDESKFPWPQYGRNAEHDTAIPIPEFAIAGLPLLLCLLVGRSVVGEN